MAGDGGCVDRAGCSPERKAVVGIGRFYGSTLLCNDRDGERMALSDVTVAVHLCP